MKKVTAYVCPKGNLERDPTRAFAWKLHAISVPKRSDPITSPKEVLDFSQALWIVENRNEVLKLLEEYEAELKDSSNNENQ